MYGLKESNTQLIINADVIEPSAKAQVDAIAKHPALQGLISIMPDVHGGKGCVIGFTGKFRNAVIPNIVGVDLGCGVTTYPLGNIDINFEDFDKFVKETIPMGFNRHKGNEHLYGIKTRVVEACQGLTAVAKAQNIKDFKDPQTQLGTLGGGNHFIEIEADEEGNKYLTVHSGSRNAGFKIANHFQKIATKFTKAMEIEVPKGLEYLPMDYGGMDYIKATYVAQDYASVNRRVMIEKMLSFFGIDYSEDDVIESIHNYIDEYGIIRKGAISAKKGETVVIPFNMAEGIIIGEGKSNSKYNFSAPHGAGRAFGRNEMKRKLDAGEVTILGFMESMKDIYSSSVSAATIDESPFAYKQFKDIEKHLLETVDIKIKAKPVYNIKST